MQPTGGILFSLLVFSHPQSSTLAMYISPPPVFPRLFVFLRCLAGVPLVFTLDKDLKPIKHEEAIPPLSARYLGDVSGIRERIEAVKAQTK